MFLVVVVGGLTMGITALGGGGYVGLGGSGSCGVYCVNCVQYA